jgi:RNA polymerase sigma factor for flagellar operon FliA
MSDDVREAEIRRLFPIVRAIARRVARLVPTADLDDLIGDGSVGLIRAVDTFDATRGVTVETYARRLVIGAILNGLRRLDPVSERVRRTLRKAEAERYALAQERGTFPAYAELERADGKLQHARAIAHTLAAVSIDLPSVARGTVLADETADPARHYGAIDARRELARAIDALPERQRRVVAMHYYGEVPLRRLSRTLAISPQRASQLHLSALRTLRTSLGGDFALETDAR